MRTGIAMGSNLGDRRAHLRKGRERILQLPKVSEPFLISGLYETEPVGCEPGAARFLNAVLEVDFEGNPQRFLRELKAIEVSLGRRQDHPQNVSRSLDLDLLYMGDRMIEDGELQLPHPRLAKRRFVLVPLADIRPELVLPGQTESVYLLLNRLIDKAEVVRLAAEW